MGAASCLFRKIITNTQILEDIDNLTAITKSKHFEKRCGLFIDFFISRRSNKIHCIFVLLY
jgi:hypothetical protein